MPGRPDEIKVPAFPEIAAFRPVVAAIPITAELGKVNPKLWTTHGYHGGTDFGCPTGTPIYSASDGKVGLVGPGEKTGLRIWIYQKTEPHGFVRFGYMHLSEIYVELDQIVKKGDKIALSGATGHVTGPHLHFQVETWPGRTLLKPVFA